MRNSQSEISSNQIGKPGYAASLSLQRQSSAMERILTFIAIIFITIACNQSPSSERPRAKSASDSLMNDVMDGHNKAMAKLSRLHETQKKCQQMADSISRLPAGSQKNSASYKIRLDSALSRLNFADYAMDKWMNEFNMDSESNDIDKRIKYLQSEKVKISKVRDVITSSLQKADSLIKK